MPNIDRRSLLATGAILGASAKSTIAATRNRGSVEGLRTAMRDTPIDVEDRQPALSWRLKGEDGTTQTAYRVLVASSAEALRAGHGNLWDSGKISSADCTGILYDGVRLRARQSCYWKVQTWDDEGKSVWSDPAFWAMGLLEASDWAGHWLAVEDSIERDDRVAGAQWVRGATPTPAQPRTFRLDFASGKGQALLTISADGVMSGLTLDGQPLALPPRDPNAYGGAPAAGFTLQLSTGNHRLEVQVASVSGFFVKPFVTLAAQLRLMPVTGSVTRITGGWRTKMGEADDWVDAELLERDALFPWPPTPARLLRREFSHEGGVAHARVYVAALGGYRIWLNGRRVNDDELQAEPANYEKRIPYRAYDVTHLLVPGANVIGAMVGDGFFASYQAPDGRYAYGPGPRRIRAVLEITRTGGGVEQVVTDEDWRHTRSPVLMSEIYAGEDQDLRLWPTGWHRPGFDERGWDKVWQADAPSARCSAALADPVRSLKPLSPLSINKLGPTRHVVDFGQNFSGRVRLKLTGTSGQTITVRHAEVLADDGSLDRRNLRAARAEDRYVLRGDTQAELLEPVFSYQGFRYVEVEGPATLRAEMIAGIPLSSAMPETGLVRIDSPVVQKLWLNTLWSQRSNFIGIPTDCPQRDERLGWTGDAQVFWDAASFNMDVGAFTRSFARILRDAQGQNGAYPLWAPSPSGLGWGADTATPGWADAGVMLPYIAYLHSGDRTLVDENWSAMTAYLNGILAMNANGLWEKGRGADLGDWLALDAKSPMDETTPKPLIATALLARSTDQMAQMAAWTGRAEDAKRWRTEHGRVRDAFAAAFVKPDGTVGNGSQCSYTLALRLNLVPGGLRAAAGQRLAADIARRGNLLTTGFLGTPLALDALADVGQVRLAWDLLMRTDYPSWGYMVKKGATTIWERWNGDTGDIAMNSFNHYALGAVIAFLYRRVAGIDPIEPGFARFRVAPILDDRVPTCSARIDTVRGPIETAWTNKDGKVQLEVTVPANCIAEVALFDIKDTLPSGKHRLIARN